MKLSAMAHASFYYFQIQMEGSSAPAIVKSDTNHFPMKKVILFAEEYNTREVKHNAKRTDVKFRYGTEVIRFPYFIIEKAIEISEEDFIFFLNEREFYFIIE